MIEKLKGYLKSHKFELVPWDYQYDPAIKEVYVEHGKGELRLAIPEEYGDISNILRAGGYDAEAAERPHHEMPTFIMVRNPHIFK